MFSSELTRRAFTTALVGGLVGPVKVARATPAPRVQSGRQAARVEILDSAGAPVPASALDRFYACDRLQRPIPIQPRLSDGMAVFEPPAEPFRVSVPLVVPGFGHVYIYADDRGAGYGSARFTGGRPLLLNHEAAADRLATARGLARALDRQGIDASRPTRDRLDRASALLGQATAAVDIPAKARLSMQSLRESLWAGEELVVTRARAAISRRGARPGFLFGANGFGYPTLGRLYAERFESLFTYATLPFYLGSTQPTYGTLDYSAAESILGALDGTSIARKGHPLVFFYPGMTPDWLRRRGPNEIIRLCTEYVRMTVSRFRHRIHVWDVVNELHGRNALGLSTDQLVALTHHALRAAREADPTCFRLVNNCCPWCEYMAREVPPGLQSIYDYLAMLRDAGFRYEAIGLQYYYYGRDLLEIERSLETFAAFGKPVHITELGLPSSSDEAPTAFSRGVRFPWHGARWSETMQADWVEQFYTMAFSKPYVEAISWWDLTDPAFVPHGGLLHEDLSPKESYRRLRTLVRGWQTAR